MKKNQNGITLIALIITIIVMIILVAVTLNIALGENGLIAKAKETRTKQEEQTIYEDIQGMMELNNNGEINVGKTFGNVVEKYTPEKVTPNTIAEGAESIEFTVQGEYGTYKYKITKTKIVISNEDIGEPSKENLKTLQELLEGKEISTTEDKQIFLQYSKYNVSDAFFTFDVPNESIEYIDYGISEDFSYTFLILYYKGEYYRIKTDAVGDSIFGRELKEVSIMPSNIILDENRMFRITDIDEENKTVTIAGLTPNGEIKLVENLNGVLTIPATIKCTNGKEYTVNKISESAFVKAKEGNKNIKTLNFDEKIAELTIEGSAFCDSGIAGELILPKSIVDLYYGAFSNCVLITDVKFECTKLKIIPQDCFNGCTGLKGKDILLPNCITNVRKGSFGNIGLNLIEIPKSVTSIDKDTFYNSENITESIGTIKYDGTKEEWLNIFSTGATIYNLDGSGAIVECTDGTYKYTDEGLVRQ